MTLQTESTRVDEGRSEGIPARAKDALRKPRVLVVEDDRHMRRLIAATLRGGGYEVVEAEDGVDLLGWMGLALWNATDDSLDAIVSDVNLPDLTALEVLEALRARDSEIPVVLVTAATDRTIHQEAYDLGAAAILTKPFDVSDLGALLKGLAQRSRDNRRGGVAMRAPGEHARAETERR